MIDIDHAFDYLCQKGITLSFREFEGWCSKLNRKRSVLIFHSFEIFIFIWIYILFFNKSEALIAFAIGANHHLFLDVIFNLPQVKTYYFYFFAARALKKFRFEDFLQAQYAKS